MHYMELLMNQWALLIDQDLQNQDMFTLEKLELLKYVLLQKKKENLN